MGTLTKADLILDAVQKYGLPKKKTQQFVNFLFDRISRSICRGETVKIHRFGAWSTRERPARSVKNPKTGEELQIGARNYVLFVPGPVLKGAANGKRRRTP